MSTDTDRSVETDQAAREATGAHPYGRYLEEFEVGAVVVLMDRDRAVCARRCDKRRRQRQPEQNDPLHCAPPGLDAVCNEAPGGTLRPDARFPGDA